MPQNPETGKSSAVTCEPEVYHTVLGMSGWPERANSLEELEAAIKSLFGKVYSPLASRLSIRRIIATLMNVSLLCTFHS